MDPGNPARYNSQRMDRPLASLLISLQLLAFGACGYQVRSSVGNLPEGIQSLGIPTFKNLSPQYKLEQRLTGAVLKEFSTRTRVLVNSKSSTVDAVLLGEIRNISSTPVTFGADSFGSAFLVTVLIRVKLVRLKDDKVLWENPDFLYRERYVLNSRLSDFFSEEGPALDRLARDFAASLAGTVLTR